MNEEAYELIAKTIRDFYSNQAITHRTDVEPLAMHFADSLATTDPQFDHNRFLIACGVQND